MATKEILQNIKEKAVIVPAIFVRSLLTATIAVSATEALEQMNNTTSIARAADYRDGSPIEQVSQIFMGLQSPSPLSPPRLICPDDIEKPPTCQQQVTRAEFEHQKASHDRTAFAIFIGPVLFLSVGLVIYLRKPGL